MLTALRNTLLVSASVCALTAILASGCSDDEAAGNSAKLDSGPFCPANLAGALDPKTACLGEGFECPIGYQCGPVDQQALCRCTKGKFVCTSSRGDDITSATDPPCTPQGGGSEQECPDTQNGTDGVLCRTPGLQCFYTGFTCPESPDVPKVDVCQCHSGALEDGGATLKFRCEIKYCNPKADAAIPIFDAGHDG